MAKPPKQPAVKRRAQPEDALRMLQADHARMKALFVRIHRAAAEERGRIAHQLFRELEIHTKLEEDIFYPAVQRAFERDAVFDTAAPDNGLDVADNEDLLVPDGGPVNGMEVDTEGEDVDEELITAAYEEHQAAKELVEQLKSLDPRDSGYHELFAELEDAVLEHVAGEEDVIFPMAATQLDLQELGAQMQRQRDAWPSSHAA